MSGFTDWHFAIVDLREVLAFQLIVRIDDMETRWFFFQECQEQIYEICFPTERPIKFAQIQDARAGTRLAVSTRILVSALSLSLPRSVYHAECCHSSFLAAGVAASFGGF